MGKVVTSQGLTEFVQSGKVTHVPDHKETKAAAAPLPEVKKEPPTTDLGEKSGKAIESNGIDKGPSEVAAQVAPEQEEGLEDADRDLPERVRKIIGKKHRAMKEAQEEAEENVRFAEQQFNERKLAEKRAAEAEERVMALEAQLQPPKPAEPELKAPSIDDFKDKATGQVDWDKYTDAKADYAAQKAVAEERKRQAEEKASAEKAAAEARVKQRFEAVRKAHPDFDRVVESVKGTEADQVPQHVLNYLFESDNGGELHYYLMKNPEETVRISKMKPILALAELGRLEDKITKPAKPADPAPAPVTRLERGGAPAPITPLSGEGTTGIVTDPSKMDFKQLREYERNRERERRRH